MKKNNKGFTLVELIVVIAILGVLMAVLVPQYIQYVEKSRQGADRSTLGEIYHSVEITAASAESITAGTFTIEIGDSDGALKYGGNAVIGTAKIEEEIEAVCPVASSALKSKEGRALADITIYISADGKVSWVGATAPKIGDTTLTGNVIATVPSSKG